LDDIFNYPNTKLAPRSVNIKPPSGQIEIRNITFGYDPKRDPILKDLSLKIEVGQTVAFIGLSGSGKTTLSKLMIGLYEPWAGDILLDGQKLSDIPKPLLTQALGVVDQEINLFSGSIQDVLTFWDNTISLEEVVAACRLAEIHDVVSKRQGGYLSSFTEGGKNFSGGQRQRFEIARALIKKPKILILDEATSALDPETEFRICNNLKQLNITLVIIAHRLSTIKDCDKIVVLDRGVIQQIGTHETLMKDSPLYQAFLKETS
jgi:ABC-type bacteriocin/lantibiotic exporter with double-glycine peptidase domain